jgi:CubicO group peptidase (beta-lactamase class C family)
MRRFAAAALWGAACFPVSAVAQTATPATAAPAAAPAPTTFTMPPAWKRQQPQASVTVLEAPEGDLHVAIVEVGAAADAEAAATSAWRAYRPAGLRKVKLITARPGRNGWDESQVIDYETSPNEHLTVQAVARRYGKLWSVLILEGSEATGEKRAAALSLVSQSMRPAGYQREMFTGRTPHALDAERVAQLVDFLRIAAAGLKVPGVGLALIDHGKIVYEGGVGVRQIGKPEPVDAHTKFMIASNTKSMATLLLAKLVDEGKLRWDEPVTEAYPQFRLGSDETTRHVLIKHLVCACTGLPRKDYEMLFNTTRNTPAAETFKILAGTEPTSGFGETFQYNNLMASAAGYIGAHLIHPDMELGRAFDRSMQEVVFDPLGMHDTTLSMEKGQRGDHASPHSNDVRGNVAVTSHDLNYAFQPFRPAGGAWSSPHDMILYIQNELTEGRLPNGKAMMAPANLLARRERTVPIGEDQWYGMGLMEDSSWGVPVIHHGGDLEGYHSDMYAIPSAQVGAVLLTNADNGPYMRRPFMRRLLELLYDGKPEAVADVEAQVKRVDAEEAQWRSKLINPVPAAIASELASSYRSPDLGPLTVTRKGDAVRLTAAAWSADVAVRHNDDKTESLVTIEPGFQDVDFVVGKDASGKRTLTTRDGQHVYVFTQNAS